MTAGVAFCLSVGAQDISKHEVSVYGGGGLSTLDYKVRLGHKSRGAGGEFGVGYSYKLSNVVRVNTGVELALYAGKLRQYNFNYNQTGVIDNYGTNPSGYEYEYYSSVKNYEEKNTSMFVNIPVMAQFSLLEDKVYLAGGIKIGIPVSGKAKSTTNKFVNNAYFPELDNWADNQEFMSLGTFQNGSYESDYDLKMAYILSLEAGYKWKLNEGMSLYTGAYFDYGLNNIQDNSGKSFVNLNKNANGVDFTTESMLNSNYMLGDKDLGDVRNESFTRKIKVMALGVKVRLGVNLSK